MTRPDDRSFLPLAVVVLMTFAGLASLAFHAALFLRWQPGIVWIAFPLVTAAAIGWFALGRRERIDTDVAVVVVAASVTALGWVARGAPALAFAAFATAAAGFGLLAAATRLLRRLGAAGSESTVGDRSPREGAGEDR